MAFKASQFSLQQGFAQALDTAQQEKRTLQGWHTQLGGNITGMDAVAMLANLSRVLGIFSTIAALPGEPARRPYEIAMNCWKKGFYVRYGGDTIQLAPPFVSEKAEIDRMINALGDALAETN